MRICFNLLVKVLVHELYNNRNVPVSTWGHSKVRLQCHAVTKKNFNPNTTDSSACSTRISQTYPDNKQQNTGQIIHYI